MPHIDLRRVPLSSLRRDGETQHRAALDVEIIEEYAALMAEGVAFPPLRVWFDGEEYWLSDGNSWRNCPCIL